MSEFYSFSNSIFLFKAKFFYKLRTYNPLFIYKKESSNYKKNGYVIFSNNEIKKSCEQILNKLDNTRNNWDCYNSFIGSPTDKFRNELIDIFRNGVDDFIKETFGSDYFIFYHVMYKSERFNNDQSPEGSQLWHADGGPGSCMNLMICHTPINKRNGAMKIINWEISKRLLTKVYFAYKQLIRKKKIEYRKIMKMKVYLRKLKCEIIKNYIEDYSIDYFQPSSSSSGTVYAFSNNCVHSGGYTEVGHKRIVSVMHIYPSLEKTSIEEKFNKSQKKVDPYPKIKFLKKSIN